MAGRSDQTKRGFVFAKNHTLYGIGNRTGAKYRRIVRPPTEDGVCVNRPTPAFG